jgi:3-oxoacyl-[acyl-carrier-protein] synthase III
MSNPERSLLESLGAYLPPKIVTTQELVKGCTKRLMLPLERLTGITSRRMAGETEFSYDLAFKAVQDCFVVSRRGPEDIDLIVCCNISRYDGPDEFSFEPGTAAKLRDAFGLHHAQAFDLTNACAGTFTGVFLADALIRSGAIRRALVVSGEYITHLAETAQREISGLVDERLPCLTLGDAGVAVILEGTSEPGLGFHGIDLLTLGRHSGLCIAKVTDRPHGGAIMTTDMITLAQRSITAFIRHAAGMAFRLGWSPAMVDHVLPHQTSKVSLGGGSRAIQSAAGDRFDFQNRVIDNVAERGNTATTSHFVALKDCFLDGRVKSGQSVMFGILASGITVGTALYRLDDLPDRVRRAQESDRTLPPVHSSNGCFLRKDRKPRVRIEAVGVLEGVGHVGADSLRMLTDACEACLVESAYDRNDIQMLLSASVYRTDFLMEPAMAALLAGALRANDEPQIPDGKKTLAFDLVNSGLGVLNACYLGAELIRQRTVRTALIAASEMENNARVAPDNLRGVRETASALMLDLSPDGASGFGAMVFRSFPDYAKSLRVYVRMHQHRIGDRHVARLYVEQDPALAGHFLECIESTVRELLAGEGLSPDDVKVILPPQVSSEFIDRLSTQLGWARARFVDVAGGGDLFTSSLAYGFDRLRRAGYPSPGDIGLIINVGAGLQVGAALYHF